MTLSLVFLVQNISWLSETPKSIIPFIKTLFGIRIACNNMINVCRTTATLELDGKKVYFS